MIDNEILNIVCTGIMILCILTITYRIGRYNGIKYGLKEGMKYVAERILCCKERELNDGNDRHDNTMA